MTYIASGSSPSNYLLLLFHRTISSAAELTSGVSGCSLLHDAAVYHPLSSDKNLLHGDYVNKVTEIVYIKKQGCVGFLS